MRLNSDFGWSKKAILTEVAPRVGISDFGWGLPESVFNTLYLSLLLCGTSVRNRLVFNRRQKSLFCSTVVRIHSTTNRRQNSTRGGGALISMPEREGNRGTDATIQK
jgi:hypothetical protein